MKKNRLVCLGVAISLLAACSTTLHTTAPVVKRTTDSSKPAIDATRSATAAAARAERKGFYTVRKGDTLYRIALESGQSYRDIVAWNKLTNPDDIKVDQVLRVTPPDGVQTGAVALAASGIEIRLLDAPPATSNTAGNNKTGPRGDKRAYSDNALAELAKPDAASTSTPMPADESAVVGEDEAVSWMWPADGKVVSAFGSGKRGIDIAGKSGQPVLAAAAGKVMYAGSGIRGYGNLVIVKHTNNLLSAYAHNETILVKEGQLVARGQKIAGMGNSDSDSVKLHFEIRQQGKPIDPSKYLPSR
ncbi:MAG: peptidoglycan DD-metalloendopeptidase family protein [Herbaspirillum sp.]